MKKLLFLLLACSLFALNMKAEPLRTKQLVGRWGFSDAQIKDIEVNPKEMKSLIEQYISQMDIKDMGNKLFEKIAPVFFDDKYCTFKNEDKIVKKKYTLKDKLLTIEGLKPHKIDITGNKMLVYVDLSKADLGEIGLSKELLAIVDIQKVRLHLFFSKK